MSLEKEIEDKFVEYAESKGCWALKLTILNQIGWPDRTILCPGGRVFFAEFKRPKGKRRKRQEYWEEILQDLGFHFFWPDEIGHAEEYLDAVLGDTCG